MKKTEQLVNEILSPPKKKAANIPIEKLHTFNGHPFKVLDNEEMEILTESIRQQGILSPLIVRPMENKPDEYEVISGHRRLYASVKAGLTQVPALIYPLDRNAAIIAVVDIQPFCRPMTYPFMRLWYSPRSSPFTLNFAKYRFFFLRSAGSVEWTDPDGCPRGRGCISQTQETTAQY